MLRTVTGYGFSKVPHFLPYSSFLSCPYSFRPNFSARSQAPYANNIDDMVLSFHQLLRMQPPPSIIQINKLLGSIAKTKHYPTTISLFACVDLMGLVPDLVTLNILINCYCRMGQMHSAFSVLGKIFKMEGRIIETETVFGKMMKCGERPDIVTYNSLMNAYCLMNKIDETKEIFNKVVQSGCTLDVVCYGILIDGLCKVKKVDEALEFFEEMCRKNIVPNEVIYSSLIDGLSKSGKMPAAEDLFFEMLDHGHAPDIITYNILLDAFCKSQNLDMGIALIKKGVGRGIWPSVYTYSILIDGFCKGGRLNTAREIFQYLLMKGHLLNVCTYNIMINGLCREGLLDEAISLLPWCSNTINKENVHYGPDDQTWNLLWKLKLP
ncbi:hypothetical protein K1719_030133 [Acacia pycnantha]|nr:hypothetical protein K1719_030133 [Acacia pycnantha]